MTIHDSRMCPSSVHTMDASHRARALTNDTVRATRSRDDEDAWGERDRARPASSSSTEASETRERVVRIRGGFIRARW